MPLYVFLFDQESLLQRAPFLNFYKIVIELVLASYLFIFENNVVENPWFGPNVILIFYFLDAKTYGYENYTVSRKITSNASKDYASKIGIFSDKDKFVFFRVKWRTIR